MSEGHEQVGDRSSKLKKAGCIGCVVPVAVFLVWFAILVIRSPLPEPDSATATELKINEANTGHEISEALEQGAKPTTPPPIAKGVDEELDGSELGDTQALEREKTESEDELKIVSAEILPYRDEERGKFFVFRLNRPITGKGGGKAWCWFELESRSGFTMTGIEYLEIERSLFGQVTKEAAIEYRVNVFNHRRRTDFRETDSSEIREQINRGNIAEATLVILSGVGVNRAQPLEGKEIARAIFRNF